MNIKVGDKIPLVLQLFDNATTKFVRAVIRDATDAPISGSPFTLAHEANGLYTNNAAVMPDTPFVSVQYLVYDDAGFTTLSEDHSSVGVEIPRLECGVEILNGGEVTGVVQSEPQIIGVVEASSDVTATVCECD